MIQPSNPVSPFGGRGPLFPSAALSLGEAGALILFFALACLAVIFVDTGLLNDDSSWYLLATRRWMDGAVLYDGVIEPNPPMMFYLTRGSIQFGAMLGLADKPAFLLFLGLAVMLCFVFVAVLLRRSALSPNRRGVFLCFVAIAFWLVPLPIFSEREHFFVIFFSPLAVWLAFEWMPGASDGVVTKTAVASHSPHSSHSKSLSSDMVGVVCALYALPGLLLKPHFFLLPLVATLLVAYRVRSLRPVFAPVNFILAIGAVGFLLFIWLVHAPYIENMVPLTWLTYVHAHRIIPSLFSKPHVLIIVPIILIILKEIAGRTVKGALWWRPSGILIGIAVAGAAVYAVQGRGAYYHIIPAQSFALLATGAWVVESHGAYLRKPLLYAVLMVLLSVIPMVNIVLYQRYADSFIARAEPIIAAQGTPKSIVAYSIDFSPILPLAQEMGIRWAGRYHRQWLYDLSLEQLYGPRHAVPTQAKIAKLETVLEYSHRTMAEDFITERPDIVLVDTRADSRSHRVSDIDFITFLSTDPRFVAAWREYRHVAVVEPSMVIYVRKDLLDGTTL